MTHKKSSHIGLGLLAGSILGVAAGLFLQSSKGKRMTKDLIKKSQKLQAKLMKELGDAKNLTKARYTEIVDEVIAYYTKTREVAKSELPEIRSFLLGKWSSIEKQIKSAKQ